MLSPKRVSLRLFAGIYVYSLLSASGFVQAAEALDLEHYFAAALQRSETVASQGELIRQAEEHYKQANAARLPTLSGVAEYTWQAERPVTAPDTPANQTNQSVTRLTLSQPLFRGFSEFAALRQTQALIGAQNHEFDHARVLLFQDVAQNFYTILSLEKDLTNYQEEIRQNVLRKQELQARVRIGRSRTSEVLNVEATISGLQAQYRQLQGQLQVAREALVFLSGLDASTPLHDTQSTVVDLEPLEFYLSGVDRRPDVLAGKQHLLAARESVSVARGAHLPTVDLNGNYYLNRPGYLDEVDWDVRLSVTVPLYAGGGTESKVQEALSLRNQAELTIQQTRRTAEQEIRSLHAAVTSDIAQRAALEKSVQAAKASYTAQHSEYKLGLVTNIDVLQALTVLQQNRRALDRARLATSLDYLRLLAAASRHPLLNGDRKP